MNSDMMWNLDLYDDVIDYDRGYWTTKDGRNLKIELMETSHIQNTINMLKRNIKKLEDYEKDYETECYENYFNFKINEFEYELKKRNVYKSHLESQV